MFMKRFSKRPQTCQAHASLCGVVILCFWISKFLRTWEMSYETPIRMFKQAIGFYFDAVMGIRLDVAVSLE